MARNNNSIGNAGEFYVLAQHPGPLAKLRLGWFVLIAALRDKRLTDQSDG